MNNGNEYFNMVLRNYEERLAAEKKELASMPEGTLIFNNIKGRISYTQLIPASAETGGRRVRRTINNEPHLIRQLARKKYLQKSISCRSDMKKR